MARRVIILTCEICGKTFEAHARRRRVHCPQCAGDLRRMGEGPVQVQRKVSTGLSSDSNMRCKGISWERVEDDLIYYLKKFKRFPVFDGIKPSDLKRITDQDRQLANRVAARMSAKIWKPIVGEPIAAVGDRNLLTTSDLEWEDRKHAIAKD